MKPKRSMNRKISDIKMMRQWSFFLRKLGVNVFYSPGFGLKESKDLVERMFDYDNKDQYPVTISLEYNILEQLVRSLHHYSNSDNEEMKDLLRYLRRKL
jgi:hypothetical protein